ncbi:aldehyde dehydrogenase family protein [Microbacterium sp. SYP-A9085]|uniref:aldehyde dehydrogenase family protein n=1 Tax=Microbacterium sp. SYP-A9085 TaxID=2664454 RepID=UPI00129C06A2|nr:aldehyde dehydrogenase family protein [Microbacterium sp. SYP-A9085]MRH30096.1 aldehyde dehydrogenase family protein [Microbacterium sp. SYP-A9085]
MTTAAPRAVAHFIAGDIIDSDTEPINRLAPATSAVVSVVQAGGEREVVQAVRAARAAFDDGPWPRMTGMERSMRINRVADLIDRDAATLAALDAEETGKPITLAENDIAGAAGLWRYAASLALTMSGATYTNNGPDFTGLVLREPIGVVGLIVPWNFPALILSQKLPFALAAGCTAIVKPSELTSSTALQIVRLTAEAGIPDGVVSMVAGDGRAGGAIAAADGIDLVSFTGSTVTGRKVVAASAGSIKKLSLELGGNAANVVFGDADLADAAAGVVFGVNFNNGECCVSQPRLLVEQGVADDFVAEVARLTKRLKVGQPMDRSTDVGALIHAGHLAKVTSYIEGAVAHSGEILVGGSRLTDGDLALGQFVAPTVIDRVAPDTPAFQEEIFGPVLTVTRFATRDEAVRLANDVPYGLANSVWSKNVDTVLEVAKALKSGTVYANTTIDAPPQMPFGGYKQSGVGREMGQAGFEEFTELKSVNIRTGRRAGTFPIPVAR